MGESKKRNKKKKISISEDDISSLLQRYSAKTIVTLLQEVAQYPDAKIDWKDLVEKTKTGIKNAREYQMVWRYMAYRDTLVENVDQEAEPVDDDSDLELDLEAFPAVNGDTCHEAAACAKILLASGVPIEPDGRPTVEGPLKINIPNDQPVPSTSSDTAQGKNIIIPVIIQKHKGKDKSGKDKSGKDKSVKDRTCPADEEGGGAGASGLRKKRKPWTEDEDLQLIAAVQKCGERNWANIVKGDFKGDRTPSQLSQRWSIIRKKQDKLNAVGFGLPSTTLTEAQLATRRAVSHALNMPMVNNLMAACSSAAAHPSIPTNSATITCVPEKSIIPVAEKSIIPVPEKSIILSTTENIPRTQQAPPHPILKPKVPVAAKKGSPVTFKSMPNPNPMIQATAVAAGARIAPPSAAASLLKAAQSKNAVHIRPGGAGPIFKTTLTGGSKPSSTVHLGSHPNVHYIRTGLAPATYSGPNPSVVPPAKPATVASSNLPGMDVEIREECLKNVAQEFEDMDEDENNEIPGTNKCVTANHMDED